MARCNRRIVCKACADCVCAACACVVRYWCPAYRVYAGKPRAKESPMIYEVTVQAPAINELVTTEADSEQQAKERAVYSAITVTVKQQR
jgi:hypothetical protein